MKTLRLGFAGLGMAAGRLIPELAELPYIQIVAGADLREGARAVFERQFGGESFATVEEMCESPNVDAIFVATPHEMHCAHTVAALDHKKHVIVEKPMALSMDEARQMYQAADRNGVKLMVGHTHSFDPPVKKMREIVASGELGRLLMVSTSYYKDHMYRPFSDHDIQTSRGVVLNQGPHQVDIVRLIGGGMVRSVRAGTGIGDPLRPGEGHYAAFLQFEDGAAASLVYSGYAYFDTGELVWGLGEGGEMKDPERHVKARRFFAGLGSGEERAKRLEQRLEQWRYGGQEQGQWAAPEDGARRQPFFGLTIVTCEKGDVRQSPDGLFIYDERGRREVIIPRGATAREAEMHELYNAIVEDRPVEHDGRWGAATIEVCLGILESSETGCEVAMKEQVPGA